MSEKVEVRGDLSQLIGGNFHEAPRQNNVVNFNVGSDKVPVQTLTDLQRKRISALVRDLCAITQEDTLDVYRVILTEFGAERMRDMPRDRYHDVVAQVERWIAENKQGAQRGSQPATEIAEISQTQAANATLHRCEACREKDISYKRLQRVSRGQWILATILGIVCGWLLYKVPMPAENSTAPDRHCLYDGKPYSVGSTLKIAGGMLRECLPDSSGAASWNELQ
nr:hypothetical protein [Herbaspirillum sp. ASV7]